jgi:hypothetical protein
MVASFWKNWLLNMKVTERRAELKKEEMILEDVEHSL